MDSNALKKLARAVISTEAAAVTSLSARIDESFVAACRLIIECRGRIVVLGMGKSGHIAGKIAATLASTGTPAFFVHPAEASHGDLGMITSDDVVLVLSNSGETDEVKQILPRLKRLGIGLIAMTGNPDSTLASHADVHLNVAKGQRISWLLPSRCLIARPRCRHTLWKARTAMSWPRTTSTERSAIS